MGIGNIVKKFQHKVFFVPDHSWYYKYGSLFVILIAISFYHRRIVSILQNKHIWATLALCVCFYNASGQTWNKMKLPQKYNGPPKNGGSGNEYICNSFNFQFAWESYIIAATYAGVVLGMILMIEAAGGINKETLRPRITRCRRVITSIGLIIFCLCCSMLLDYLRKKRWHYSGIFLLHMP